MPKRKRRAGRPKLLGDMTVQLAVRIPAEINHLINAYCANEQITASTFVRRAIRNELMRSGR